MLKASTRLVPIVVAVGVAVSFLVWRVGMLELAKFNAIRKFSSDGGHVLNCVPSSAVLSIPNHDPAAGLVFVHPPGCDVGLPKSEFQRDPTQRFLALTNSEWLIACFGTLDKTNFTTLEQGTGCTNVFDFVSNAYYATVNGISDQWSMTQLRRYLVLLLYKATTAPVGFDQQWLRFDRGDFHGFISVDLSNRPQAAVEAYLPKEDEFLLLGFWRKGKAGGLPDIEHILSEIEVSCRKP
jgi:hypothetical protein